MKDNSKVKSNDATTKTEETLTILLGNKIIIFAVWRIKAFIIFTLFVFPERENNEIFFYYFT